MRYLAGVASALLLVAAGFFLWTGLARGEGSVPSAPPQAAPSSSAAMANATAVIDPPQATERTREQKRFDRYDRNRDGKVDRDEYLLNRRKAFAKLDTDGDGKLSFDEYSARAIAKFAKADADRSGALIAAEFATTRVERKPEPESRCPARSRRRPGRTRADQAGSGSIARLPLGQRLAGAGRHGELAVGLAGQDLERREQAEIDVHRLVGLGLAAAGDVADQRAQRRGRRRGGQLASGQFRRSEAPREQPDRGGLST